MKLVIAIVHDEDSARLIVELGKNQISVTKLASTGGFLHSGNVTLMVGVEKEKVDFVIDIIKSKCKSRTELTSPPSLNMGMTIAWPVEVSVGGATIFVLDIDRFEKV